MPILPCTHRPHPVSTEELMDWAFDMTIYFAVQARVDKHGPFSNEPGNTDYEDFIFALDGPGYQDALEMLDDLGNTLFIRHRHSLMH